LRLTGRKPYWSDDSAFATERQRAMSTSALSRIPLDAQAAFPPPEISPLHPGLRLSAWLAAVVVPWLAIAGLFWAGILLFG
jgi:hypothetical protein